MRRRLTPLVAALAAVAAAAAAGAGGMGAQTGAAPVSPRTLFTDVTAGPTRGGPLGLGIPITIYGAGLGDTRGTSTVTIGGREVARYVSWEQGAVAGGRLDRIVVQPGPKVTGGPIAVRIGGRPAAGHAAFVR